MKLSHLVKVMSDGRFDLSSRAAKVLPRFAAMQGIEITERQCNYAPNDPEQNIEISQADAKAILAMDYAERQTENLRAMGEGIGKLSIHVPSNINVWQHLKGASTLTQAANSLSEAAKVIAEKATS